MEFTLKNAGNYYPCGKTFPFELNKYDEKEKVGYDWRMQQRAEMINVIKQLNPDSL